MSSSVIFFVWALAAPAPAISANAINTSSFFISGSSLIYILKMQIYEFFFETVEKFSTARHIVGVKLLFSSVDVYLMSACSPL
jgi:hypothetical protein